MPTGRRPRLSLLNSILLIGLPVTLIFYAFIITWHPESFSKHVLTKEEQLMVPARDNGMNRVYCMVPFLWTPNGLPTYHGIRATWGKRCDVLKFFVDPIIGDNETGFFNLSDPVEARAASQSNMTMPYEDVVVVHGIRRPWHTCGDSSVKKDHNKNCRNIWEKIWRSWVHVVYGDSQLDIDHGGGSDDMVVPPSSEAFSAEWFVKVDADTYLFPDNTRRFVEANHWSYNDHHYFGHALFHRLGDRKVPLIAGAAVFFSRATLLGVAEVFKSMPLEYGMREEDGTCRDAYSASEEVVTAVCLNHFLNITAEAALDPIGREAVTVAEVEHVAWWNRTAHGEWWFWAGKKRVPCHDDLDCVSHLPMAFHGYKDPIFFKNFDEEFYGSLVGESLHSDTEVVEFNGKRASKRWNNHGNTVGYFDKVREAMKNASEAESTAENLS